MKKTILYKLVVLLSILPLMADAASVQPFVNLLGWKASETNTSFATTITSPGNATRIIQSNPNFNTRAGVKAGLLYAPDNFWDTKLYWTYFPTSTTKTVPVGISQIVSSLFFSGSFFISEDLFFGCSANWDLVMNMVDLEISHAFKPSNTLLFSPKIGVKGGSINQTIDINWDAILYQSTENLSNNFTGIGPSFGLGAKWMMIDNVSLVGDIATALMYGRWNDTDTYQRPATLFSTRTTISTSSTQSKLGTMMMDYYLGLEWQHHGKSKVTVKLGYEMQYWPNQLRLMALQQLPTFGDLTIQGASCGISIDL